MSDPLLMVWDDASSGHHPTYLHCLVHNADPKLRLVVPDWTPPAILSASANAKRLPPGLGGWLGLSRSVEVWHPDVLILLDGHRYLPHLSLMRIPVPITLVDIRARHVMSKRDPWAGRAKSLVSRIVREAAVRRNRVAFLCLDGSALQVGTRRLRRSSGFLPELLPERSVETRLPSSTADVTILLCGSLDGRKGVALLLESVRQLVDAPGLPPFKVLISGEPAKEFRARLKELALEAHNDELPVEFELGFQPETKFIDTLASADVVLLPYIRHRGGSGILALLDGARKHVVVSDYGWLGFVASKCKGVRTFRDSDASSLTQVMKDVLTAGQPEQIRLASDCYSRGPQFARRIFEGMR